MKEEYKAFHMASRTSTNYVVCSQCQQGCLNFEVVPGKNNTYPYKCTKNSTSTAAYICTQSKPYTTTNYCEKYETVSKSENQNASSLSNSRSPKRRKRNYNNQEKDDTISNDEITVSPKNWWVTFFLCLIFGSFGIHRFYTGKIGSGIIMLLTMGGFGIWTLIDLIMLIMENFTDNEGNYIFR